MGIKHDELEHTCYLIQAQTPMSPIYTSKIQISFPLPPQTLYSVSWVLDIWQLGQLL